MFRFIEETFQVSLAQIDRSTTLCRKFWQTYRASNVINIQCKRSKLRIYFRVRSVLVKLQPAFQSLHQVEDSSNQSPGSKQSWNSFVRRSSKYSSSYLHEENSRKENYLFIPR